METGTDNYDNIPMKVNNHWDRELKSTNSPSGTKSLDKRNHIRTGGGPMSLEEARMNKKLLQEISKIKKE